MGVGVYVKPSNPSALDIGGGGGGFAGGRGTSWQPSTVNLRPVNPSLGNARVGGRPSLPSAARSRIVGLNGRLTSRNTLSPPQTTAPPPSQSLAKPISGRGVRSTGFGQMLRAAGTPQSRVRSPQAFGRTAGNAPLRSAPRPVPIDTPTAGAKRPFNFRAPLSNTSPLRLPGNPFARQPRGFNTSGANEIDPPTYPGQMPREAISPGTSQGISPENVNGPIVTMYNVFGTILGGSGNPENWSQPFNINGYLPNSFWRVRPQTQDFGFRGVWNMGIELVSNGGVIFSIYEGVGFRGISSTITGYLGNGEPLRPVVIPNPMRPQTPNPLPGATPEAIPLPAAPRPQFTNPGQPAKQPLPYISTEPARLAPGQAPLPERLQTPTRPQTRPQTKPPGKAEKSPLGNTNGNGSPFTPQTAFSTGVALGGALANSAFKPINSAEAQAIKELLKNGIKLANGQTQPSNTPVKNLDKQGLPDPLIEVIKEAIATEPAERFERCPKPTSTNCKYDDKNISGKCDDIIEKLEGDYSLSWNLPECGQDFSINRTGEKSGTGLDGIAKQIEVLLEAIKVLHENSRCESDIIVGVPDDYGRSPETNRPTLILFYKEKTGQKWNRSTYTTTIFYPKPDVILGIFEHETLIPPARNIGNGFASLTLPDSSKLRAFGLTESGAISTISWMAQYCMLVPNDWQAKIVSGSRHGLSNKLVYPRKAEYYATGFKAEAVPDRKITFGNAL